MNLKFSAISTLTASFLFIYSFFFLPPFYCRCEFKFVSSKVFGLKPESVHSCDVLAFACLMLVDAGC